VIFGVRQIEARRAALVERCTGLRASLQAAGAPLGARLVAADRLVSTIRSHPLVFSAAATALTAIGRRILPAWLARGFLVYSLLRR